MDNELIAIKLDQYRSANGTRWKSKLKELFYSGRNQCPYLQQFRNKYYDVLNKITYHTTRREIIALLDKRGQR